MTNSLIKRLGFLTSRRSRALSVFGTTSLIFCINGFAAASTVYVPTPTGDPTTDWNNVQAAVNSADDGDTVQFAAGTYIFGDDSDFIVVNTPELRLVGSPDGTTILGGDVPSVPETEPCEPYLYGDCSLLQSPPRGFHLTADEQSISNIRFEGFRTAVLMGFDDFAKTGGYNIETCEFVNSLYGIQAHVESDNASVVRGNDFINNLYPFHITGGRYYVGYNYVASPDPEKVPIDGYTHAAGSLNAGIPFFEEGNALVSEGNVFEYNVGDGIADGFQIFGDADGLIRNNIFRNNEFHDMTNYYGTFSLVLSFGGDVVDNAFVNNTVDGSWVVGFAILSYAGAIWTAMWLLATR